MNTIGTLEFLQMLVEGKDVTNIKSPFLYPTTISKTLEFELIEIAKGEAKVQLKTDTLKHGNQQGTVHGGLLCELADAAIGTAHSTLMAEGETFTSIELKINFLRPTWNDILVAHAKPIQSGKTLTIYECIIYNKQQKKVAVIISTVMTLIGEKGKGR